MRLTAGPLMYVERLEAMLHEFSALTLDGGEWLDSRPGRFTPTERGPGAHWRGG